ncbi:Rv2175c family DNA-binding protein [Jannaschia sp. R86511]|uniref:Rv2175c family DNA-binding protein n=1 Tax=Jannaschia sp. R86511 TaxID=3093853 RepID=UPI0036D248FF
MARSRDRRPHVPAPGLRPVPEETLDAAGLAELESLVGDWLTVPDVADRLGTDIMKVRRLIGDGELAAVRVGGVLKVPALFVVPGAEGAPAAPLHDLKGTLTLLADARYSTAEAIRWLWTPDETLREGRPIDTLLAGRKTEIRRRAQALGF